MEYTKPEVTFVADAARAIQSMKPEGALDVIDPTNPEKSVAAFDLDA